MIHCLDIGAVTQQQQRDPPITRTRPAAGAVAVSVVSWHNKTIYYGTY